MSINETASTTVTPDMLTDQLLKNTIADLKEQIHRMKLNKIKFAQGLLYAENSVKYLEEKLYEYERSARGDDCRMTRLACGNVTDKLKRHEEDVSEAYNRIIENHRKLSLCNTQLDVFKALLQVPVYRRKKEHYQQFLEAKNAVADIEKTYR